MLGGHQVDGQTRGSGDNQEVGPGQVRVHDAWPDLPHEGPKGLNCSTGRPVER